MISCFQYEYTEEAFAIDEPFDAETLCEIMHSRRLAAEREWATGAVWGRVPCPSLGLFSVGCGIAAGEADEAEEGIVYSKLLGREV